MEKNTSPVLGNPLAPLIDDIFVDGMFHCVALRSRIQRGRIKSIIPPPLPDTVYYITSEDIPGTNSIEIGKVEVPILTDRQIDHPGQAIALLCGPDELELQRLLEQFEVQYERDVPFELTHDYADEQLYHSRDVTIGNPAAAFEKAFQIIEGEYKIEPGCLQTVHPIGAFAYREDNRMMVLAPTRWLHRLRAAVAAALGLPNDQVHAGTTPLTRSARGNLWYPALIAAQTAVAATAIDRPVRMILSPKERRQLTARRSGCLIHHKTALSKTGTIVAMEIVIVAEDGAFPTFPVEHLDRLCLSGVGHYAFKSLKIEGKLITTSRPPVDTHGGLGFSNAFFALEVHATRLAELAGENPISWRLKNLLSERSSTVSRARAGSTPQRALLSNVVRVSDFERKYSANEMLKTRRGDLSPDTAFLRGIGIAGGFVGAGFMSNDGPETASVSVRLDSNGLLNIKSSCAVEPETSLALFAETATKVLGLDIDRITLEPPTTDAVPDSGPAVLSRNVTVIRKLVESCAQAIQKKRFRAPLPMEISRSRRGGGGRNWDAETFRGTPFSPLSWASCVVEVELDTVSFEIGLRGIWLSLAIGKVVDSGRIKAVIEAELAEQYGLCRGYETQWSSSGPASSAGPPEISIEFVPGTGNRAGAVDGLVSNTFAPAFVSAVSQATGFYFDCIPLTRSLILQYTEA